MCRHFTQYYLTYSDKLRSKNKRAESRRKYFSRERCTGGLRNAAEGFRVVIFYSKTFVEKIHPNRCIELFS